MEKRAIVVYAKPQCAYCTKAKALLDSLGLAYEVVDVSDKARADAMKTRLGVPTDSRVTVPQIFVGETPIGGYVDLQALCDRGELINV